MLMRAFVQEGNVGVTVLCPRLQYFNFGGEINFSVQTLQLFLNGKHIKITTPDISPWKRVMIDISRVAADPASSRVRRGGRSVRGREVGLGQRS